MRKAVFLIIVLATVFAFAAPAFAATAEASFNTKLTVNPAIQMFLRGTLLNFGAFNPGDTPAGTFSWAVQSNCAYTEVVAMSDLVGPTPPAGMSNVIPATDFTQSVSGAVGSPHPGAALETFSATYNKSAGLPWTLVPGDYAGTVLVTLTSS